MNAEVLLPDLKPCPFCGGEPSKPMQQGGSDERNGYNFTVCIRCKKCGAHLVGESRQGKAGWCDDTGQAEESVIAAWNRRSPAAGEKLPVARGNVVVHSRDPDGKLRQVRVINAARGEDGIIGVLVEAATVYAPTAAPAQDGFAIALGALAGVTFIRSVDELANIIRFVDGENSAGAGALAERIFGVLELVGTSAAPSPPMQPHQTTSGVVERASDRSPGAVSGAVTLQECHRCGRKQGDLHTDDCKFSKESSALKVYVQSWQCNPAEYRAPAPCSECGGAGTTDSHVTGEVECGACEGTGSAPPHPAAPQDELLREALAKAADTFADAAKTFDLFQKPLAALAMQLAEKGCRAALQPEDKQTATKGRDVSPQSQADGRGHRGGGARS